MRKTVVSFLFSLLITLPLCAQQDVTWATRDAQTELLLNEALFRDLGLTISNASTSSLAHGVRKFTFEAPPPSGLLFRTRDGDFDNLVGGRLIHHGGFELSWTDGTASLVDFTVRPGREPQTLEILASDGQVIFVADHMHFSFDPDHERLSMFNLDLRLSPDFAERIAEPRHALLPVGQMVVDSTLDTPIGYQPTEGGCSGPVWDADVDVGLLDMASVSQTVREAGVRVAVTPSAKLINVGTAEVPWYSKLSGSFPPFNNDQHPFLIWNMYRIVDGVIQQIGVSPLKHAFLTVNSGCSCSGGHILWAASGAPNHPATPCTDTYGSGTNSSRNSLTERHEINPYTGIWTSCGSIFDPDCDGNLNTPPIQGNFDRRMAVAESDLQVAGAEYFFEAWYVVRDDINIFNTMGYKQVQPQLSGNTWSFSLLTPLIEGPVLNRWVDPAAPDPGTQAVALDTGEGHLQLSVRSQNLGGGLYRYEYALMNYDLDRQLSSFSIPLPTAGGRGGVDPVEGATTSDPDFADADVDPANDWTFTTSATAITWTAPNPDSGHDWGRLYRFGITVNAPPIAGDATYTILEGAGGTGTLPSLVPGSLEIFKDGFESGDTGGWSSVVSD